MGFIYSGGKMQTPEQKLEMEKFFKSMGMIAGTCGKMYGNDRKFNMADLPLLMELIINMGELMDGFDDIDIVIEGFKNSSMDQVVDSLKAAVNLGKQYETARKA